MYNALVVRTQYDSTIVRLTVSGMDPPSTIQNAQHRVFSSTSNIRDEFDNMYLQIHYFYSTQYSIFEQPT